MTFVRILGYKEGSYLVKRKLYKELYEVHNVIDPTTGKDRKETRYRGPYYRLLLSPAQKMKQQTTLFGYAALSVGLFLICGFINLPGSRCPYVLPFFLLTPFPLFYLCLAVFRLFRLPALLTRIHCEECPTSLLRSCYGLMTLCGLYVVGDIVFLATGGANDNLGLELFGLSCMILICVATGFATRIAHGLELEEVHTCPIPSAT